MLQALRRRAVTLEPVQPPTQYQPAFHHRAMHDWEGRLHRGLRIVWPCEESLEFQALWPSVVGRAKSVGVDEAHHFNLDMARGLWCLLRHLKPRTIVETGVGLGVTSRFILEALAMNRSGHLFSVEPPDSDPALRSRTGFAVEPRVAHRWSLIVDTTKRALPGLLPRLGLVDLYVHDCLSTGNMMRHEIDMAWAALKPGGALVFGHIDYTGAFQYFAQSHSGYQALIGETDSDRVLAHDPEPKSQFAIAFKNWR
jgi:hypothetical protein